MTRRITIEVPDDDCRDCSVVDKYTDMFICSPFRRVLHWDENEQRPVPCEECSMKMTGTLHWVSVKDTLPGFFEEVLIAWGENQDNISIGSYNNNYEKGKIISRWYSGKRICSWEITHWMPVPKAPKEKP